MSKRKTGVVDIRMDPDTIAQVEQQQQLGAYWNKSRSDFLGYLVWLGVQRYRYVIKAEKENNEIHPTGRRSPPAAKTGS